MGDFLLTSVNRESDPRRQIQLFLKSVRTGAILGSGLGLYEVISRSSL